MFPGNVPKMDQAQTFLATIENDHCEYEDFGCYFDSGAAAYTDQLLTGDQETVQPTN